MKLTTFPTANRSVPRISRPAIVRPKNVALAVCAGGNVQRPGGPLG